MPIQETNYTDLEIREGLKLLDDLLKDDTVKLLIINTIDYNMNHAKKPVRFFKLRDEILPSFLGDEASKALFWYLFGGWLEDEEKKNLLENLDQQNIAFLYYLFTTYAKDFITAKKFNINPMGYDELQFSYGNKGGYNNLIISRNDYQSFVLSVNDDSFIQIINDMVRYYNMLVKNEGRKLENNTTEIVNEIIEQLTEIKGEING